MKETQRNDLILGTVMGAGLGFLLAIFPLTAFIGALVVGIISLVYNFSFIGLTALAISSLVIVGAIIGGVAGYTIGRSGFFWLFMMFVFIALLIVAIVMIFTGALVGAGVLGGFISAIFTGLTGWKYKQLN